MGQILSNDGDLIRPKKDDKRIACITTYHPIMPLVQKAIRKNWGMLRDSYPQIDVFQNPPLTCYKRFPNLRDKIVRADIGSLCKTPWQTFLQTQRQGTFPCLSCGHCSSIIRGDSISHPQTGQKYPVRGYYTCESSFVVYLLKCPCGLAYVGETAQRVQDRLTKHKSTIRCRNLMLPLPSHFDKAGHNISQLRYQIIEHVLMPRQGGNRIPLLKQRESFWIHRLNTLNPNGLNRECDFLFL